MKVSCTQLARLDATPSSIKRASADSTKRRASSAVAAGASGEALAEFVACMVMIPPAISIPAMAVAMQIKRSKRALMLLLELLGIEAWRRAELLRSRPGRGRSRRGPHRNE